MSRSASGPITLSMMRECFYSAVVCDALDAVGLKNQSPRIPLAPLILGVVLGDQIEANLIQAVSTDADPWLFVTRPISGAMLAASILSIALAVWQHRRETRRLATASEEEDTDF